MTRITSHPSSFRVFRGYRKPELSEVDFLSEVGEVFMPGTPLLLQPLGLAGYLPALLPEADPTANVPDEVAIIAYASQERYDEARNRNIQGRMYTHTHLAVFDMTISRSQFPSAIGDDTAGAVHAFYLNGAEQDWQNDGDVIFWAGQSEKDAPAATFLQDVRALGPALAQHGVLECIGQVGPRWATLWLLLDHFLTDRRVPDDISRTLTDGVTSMQTTMSEIAERLIWRHDVPPAPAARGRAFGYIFERDQTQFLQ